MVNVRPSANMTTPAVATPAVATPAVATPAVATPAVATPAVATPAVATPAVATPAVATPANKSFLPFDGKEGVKIFSKTNLVFYQKSHGGVIVYGKKIGDIIRALTVDDIKQCAKLYVKYKEISIVHQWIHVFIYCRVSTPTQKLSLKSQEERIRHFLHNGTNGYRKVFENFYPIINTNEFFEDFGDTYYKVHVVYDICSAYHTMSGKLIDILKTKNSIIIADDTDRLSRSVWSGEKILAAVKENNIRLMTVDRTTSKSSGFWKCIDSQNQDNWGTIFIEQVLWAERDSEKKGMRRQGKKSYKSQEEDDY